MEEKHDYPNNNIQLKHYIYKITQVKGKGIL